MMNGQQMPKTHTESLVISNKVTFFSANINVFFIVQVSKTSEQIMSYLPLIIYGLNKFHCKTLEQIMSYLPLIIYGLNKFHCSHLNNNFDTKVYIVIYNTTVICFVEIALVQDGKIFNRDKKKKKNQMFHQFCWYSISINLF